MNLIEQWIFYRRLHFQLLIAIRRLDFSASKAEIKKQLGSISFPLD